MVSSDNTAVAEAYQRAPQGGPPAAPDLQRMDRLRRIRICQTTGDRDEQDRMNCVRTSVGKPHDELRGYNGLVDCIGKAAADRIAKLVGQYCGREEGSLAVIQEAKSEIVNFGFLKIIPIRFMVSDMPDILDI